MDNNELNVTEEVTENVTETAESVQYTANDYSAWEQEEPKAEKKTMGIVSLITGICSTVCCCVPCISWLCGITAIVFGAIGLKKDTKTTLAKIGLILGIVGLVLGIICFVVALITQIANDGSSSYYY